MFKILFVLFGTIIMVAITALISPILKRLQEKKYLTQDYTVLNKAIYKTPVCEFKYYVSHSKLTGHWSREGRKGPEFVDTQFRIILYKNFLIITTCGIAEKISYNELITYAETNWLGYYYGNIVIHKNEKIYNIVVSENKTDFDTIKNIIETYKTTI